MMDIAVLGAGMMGQAIVYDLCKFSNFDKIILTDSETNALHSVEKKYNFTRTSYVPLDVSNKNKITELFSTVDVVISAVPYRFNYDLTQLAIQNNCHFLDLGGNNDIVHKQLSLCDRAKNQSVIGIPDCGLAPGLVSIITKDIVESMDSVDTVKLRVGGLPVHPQPPLKYQIVFSPNGLINEYVEDALILDHGVISTKNSMTEIESIEFPDPFGRLEAFLTSGGCSTLPYTYKDTIQHLDYKTIRYPGHCEQFQTLLSVGLAKTTPFSVTNKPVVPREFFISLLNNILPKSGEDVVLLKVIATGQKNSTGIRYEYQCIDYADKKTGMSAMMRMTGFPVSIIAQMIEKSQIKDCGIFACEHIIPCSLFFSEMKKRNIDIIKKQMVET